MRVTATLTDEQAAHVEEREGQSDAARVRRCIERSQELDECRDRVADLEQRVERLAREKRLILEEREDHSQLVRAVEREQSLAEERAQAGVLTRAKWWLVGRDDEE